MNSTNTTGPLVIGREYPKDDERSIADEMIKLLKDQMLRMYPPGTDGKIQLRQIHPKLNGCVKAEFIIEPGLPGNLKIGLFKKEKTYPAWIRFSNGKTHPIPDYKKDIRGFAIKLLNVPGEKLDHVHTDITNFDFILMNTKNFVSEDIRKFKDILYVVTTPFSLGSLPKKIGIALRSLPILKRAKAASINILNPAEIPYYSTVPYRFGDETKAVKYEVRPAKSNQLLTPDKTSEDLLRVNLAATLKEHEIVYDFGIQFQTDAEKMPIEDPTVIWDSPFIKLATIRIPKQDCDTEERRLMGENIALNSWHCLPEHQPLGAFNRVRKYIYEELYASRHAQNGVKDEVLQAGPDYFNDIIK